MTDRLGWVCARCGTSVSPDCIDCSACSPDALCGVPFMPAGDPGHVFAPMRADLTATPGQVRDLQAALTAAASGMLAAEIVVLPPGSKVMVRADQPEPVPHLGEDFESVRCPECHMPLTMHHDPRCSRPCERCEERKAKDSGERVRQTIRILGHVAAGRRVTRLTGEWREMAPVFPGLQARLADEGTVQADVEFRLTPQDGQEHD